jgi:hypothetical protein
MQSVTRGSMMDPALDQYSIHWAERVRLTRTSTEICIGPGRREELASGIYLTADEL